MTEQLKGLFANAGGAKKEGAEAAHRGRAQAADRRKKPPSSSTTTRSKAAALANAEQKRHRLHRRDRQGSRHAARRAAPTSRARGVQARPAAAGRGHDREHQVRAWSRPTTCCSSRRGAFHLAKPSDLIPELQGRFSDPRRARLAQRRRFRGDPDADARRAWSSSTPCCSRPRGVTLELQPEAIRRIAQNRVRCQRAHREHRRAAPVDGDGAAARTRSASTRPKPRRSDRARRCRRGQREARRAGEERRPVALTFFEPRLPAPSPFAPRSKAPAGAPAAAAAPRRSACSTVSNGRSVIGASLTAAPPVMISAGFSPVARQQLAVHAFPTRAGDRVGATAHQRIAGVGRETRRLRRWGAFRPAVPISSAPQHQAEAGQDQPAQEAARRHRAHRR